MTTTSLEQIKTTGTQLFDTAAAVKIVSIATYQRAGAVVQDLLAYIRAVDDFMDPIVRAADLSLKTARSQRDSLRNPALELKRTLGSDMEAWDRAERDRLRREQDRLAHEAQAEAQAAALLAADARDDEGAVAAIAAAEAPIVAFAPPPPEPPKADGVSYRVTWSAEVTDLLALVQAVAAGQVPLKVLQPDSTVLNTMARALKESLALPGVKAVARREPTFRQTARRTEVMGCTDD